MRYFVLLLLVGCGGGTFFEPDAGSAVVSDAGAVGAGQCFPGCATVSCGGVEAYCGTTCEAGSGCAFQGCKVDCTATAVAQCTDPNDPNTPTAICMTNALINCSTHHFECCQGHAAHFPLDTCG